MIQGNTLGKPSEGKDRSAVQEKGRRGREGGSSTTEENRIGVVAPVQGDRSFNDKGPIMTVTGGRKKEN